MRMSVVVEVKRISARPAERLRSRPVLTNDRCPNNAVRPRGKGGGGTVIRRAAPQTLPAHILRDASSSTAFTGDKSSSDCLVRPHATPELRGRTSALRQPQRRNKRVHVCVSCFTAEH